MSKLVKVGLIGCGVVGQGVVRLLAAEADEIERKTGLRIEVALVADKDVAQARKAEVSDDRITTDAAEILQDKSISVIVELVGGTGVAKDFVLRALKAGKDVVTAVRHG